MSRSAEVVVIGQSFIDQYRAWNLDTGHVTLIPNWAPLDEIVPLPGDPRWLRKASVPNAAFRLVYERTLGRKHNPKLLIELLDGCRAKG